MEFAIVIPIFVLLVIGVFEFALAWKTHQALSDATRESVRTWVTNCAVSVDTVRQRVVRGLVNSQVDTIGLLVNLSATSSGCGCTPPTGSPPCPDSLGVQSILPHTFGFLRPFMGWTTGQANITLSTESWMRREW